MIIGLGYNNIYPEVIHTLPNGLQILKSRFLPDKKDEYCCIGGPLGTLSPMVDSIGLQSTMYYMSQLIANYNNYRSKMDYFPSLKSQ